MSSSAGSTMAPGDGSEAPVATKTTVIIGNLKRDVDKEALNTLLCQLGRVTNFRLQQPPGVDPASPATGIVEYASAEDASRVVAHVHGKLILGRPVTAWVPVPGSSPPPLPQVAPVPDASPNRGPTTGGPAQAAYPGDMNNGARYSTPPGQISGHEDPRWERPPPPSQQGQRGPPASGAYGDGYSHNQRQRRWHAGGRPTPQQGGSGGAAAAAGASRFRGEGDPAHYAERQWQDQGHEEDDDSGAWERSERHHYPQPAHRAPPPMRREHPAAYHRPPPSVPPHASAGWYEGADSRGVAAHAAYGGGGGGGQQLRGPPGRGMMPRDGSGGSAAVPTRGSDDGYGDEGILAGKRRRPPPPGGAARGGMLPPGRAAGAAAAAWTDDAEYTVPPPAISIKGEDFEKEVVKAAALLVAEREMRAREEARKQGKGQDWPDGVAPPGDKQEENRTTEVKKKGSSKARGRSRSAGEEGKHARKKSESSSGRGSGEYQDGKGDDNRPKKKRNRRDDGSSSSPHGKGRADISRADDRDRDRDRDRHSSNGKKRGAAEEGSPSSKGKPKAAREESRGRHHPANDHRDRDRHCDDSRGRPKDRQDSRSRDKETHSSRSRPSAAKPAGSSGWDRDQDRDQDYRSGGGGSTREGGPWEHSTADTGYCVHVSGLSFSTTFTTLAKRFAAFGDVNGFKVVFDKVSCSAAATSKRRGSKDEVAKAAVVTASSGFAFISFDNERGMEKAVECMDGQELDGYILKVTRRKSTARATAALDAYHSQTGPASSAQRASHSHRRPPEPRGNQEHDQQIRKVHKPQPGRPGNRRQAPISSTSSAAMSSLMRDAQGSRGGGGGGVGGRRAGGGGGSIGGGRNGAEKNRDPSPDPLGALRSPRPTASSRKEAPGVKPEANGRLKAGNGGKLGSRGHGGGGGGGGGDSGSDTRIVGEFSTADIRTSNAGTARPTNPAGSDFYTSRFRRP